MDLPFDDRKLLLPGVHDVTMDTAEEHFGRFQKSDRRMKLFERLTAYVDALKKAECGESLIIDGSFVMGCIDEPEDIDLVLVLPDKWDMAADLKPYQYNLVSKRDAKRTYGFDVFVVKRGSADEERWIEFYGRTNLKWREKFGWPPDAEGRLTGAAMAMIRDDEELAVQQKLLGIVEEIVESWRKQLLPHNPKNFAIYAEGAIEEADKLRAEIDEYLARKKTGASVTNGTPPAVQQPVDRAAHG